MAKQTAQSLAASLGFAQAFFSADPELKALLQKAVAAQWDSAQFQAAFMNTKWYRARQASVRQWADLTTRDPKEAQAKIAERSQELSDQFTQLGVTLSARNLSQLAVESLQYAWSDAQLKNVLASYIHSGNLGGTAATLEDQIRQVAGDYGLKVSDSQVTPYVVGLINQSYSMDNITDFFRDMARSKYPGMGQFLDKGYTVRQVAQPYVQSYSQLLETDPDTVDLNDSLIQKALQGNQTDPTKPPAMQSVYQFEQAVRGDSRWLQTKNAHQSMTSAAMGIARDWGLVG